MMLVTAVMLGSQFLVRRAGGEQTECAHGMGYYMTEGGWEQCPLSGPDGYYDEVSFWCLKCDEPVCDAQSPWYNHVEDGDYVCHNGTLEHMGHQVSVTAKWIHDELHQDYFSIIEEYYGGEVDLHFDYF